MREGDLFMAFSNDGFDLWRAALSADSEEKLETSASHFRSAAKEFFDEGSSKKAGVGKALFEFSTLMDAFSSVQEARVLKSNLDFDHSLSKFEHAAEIFRSTIHYAFLSGYVSGCASLETALEMEASEDAFQGFKNANALFEQAKLLLSFRDERHPFMHNIDVLLKYSISRALLVESQIISASGASHEARKKKLQSLAVEADFEQLVGKKAASKFKIKYLLDYECKRRGMGALPIVFPELRTAWIGNVGKHGALLVRIGNRDIGKTIGPDESLIQELEEDYRGKLRLIYEDTENGDRFDEGCLTVI